MITTQLPSSADVREIYQAKPTERVVVISVYSADGDVVNGAVLVPNATPLDETDLIGMLLTRLQAT